MRTRSYTHTHTHTHISSSSYRAISTDLPDLLPPPVSIVHRSPEVFQATSCIGTALLYVSSSWSSGICTSMWRGPLEYFSYQLVLTSPAVSRMSSLSNLDSFRGGWLAAVQLPLCGALPSGLVQYCSQHFYVITVQPFLHTFS